MTDLQINNTALLNVKRIDEEFTEKVMTMMGKNIGKMKLKTGIENYGKEIFVALARMLSDTQYNFFMVKWALLGDMDKKESIEMATYDNGRKLGMLQGFSLAIANITNKTDDVWWQPVLNTYLDTKPLTALMDLTYNTLFDEAYKIFDKLYTKEMNKSKITRKDLLRVLSVNRGK